MALSKYFRFPFALTGDKAPVPDDTQPSGEVSFEEGYGLDYELDPATEPSAKNIERDKANQLYYDITQAIKELQEFGIPYWIEPAQNGGVDFPYAKFALVRYDTGLETPIFQSLVDNNTDLPTVTSSWKQLASANPFIEDNATFEASVTDGEIVYWDNANNRFDEAVADGTAAQNAVGISDVTNSRVFLFGAIPTGVLSGLAPNSAYFLSPVTPGAITTVRPANNAVQIGVSKSATTFFLNITTAQAIATEAIAGLVELATNAEAQAFTANKIIDGAKLATAFQGANQSLAASGYQRLPGGLIVQWGKATTSGTVDVTVTYPVAFPTATASLTISSAGAGGGNFANYNTTTESSFKISAWTATTVRASTQVFWVAIGY